MKLHKFTFNLFSETTMVLSGTPGKCVIVDPGFSDADEKKQLFSYLESEGLEVEAILVTHGHYDHTVGILALQTAFGCPVYMSDADKPLLSYNRRLCGKLGIEPPVYGFIWQDVTDGSVIKAAGFEFKVITTPGHSPGSVCYLEEKENFILTGDTLFAGTIGRTDLEYGEYNDIIISVMEKLMLLDSGLTVYPGHGPSTTIGYERMNNPFLEPFNE